MGIKAYYWMRRIPHLAFVLIVSLVIIGIVPLAGLAGGISPKLKQKIKSASPSSRHKVILKLPKSPSIEFPSFKGKSKAFRNKTVVVELRRKAQQSQLPILQYLEKSQITGEAEGVKSLWIVNAVVLDATSDLIANLASNYSNLEIIPDQIITLGTTTQSTPGIPEWNLVKIKAPDMWDLGYRGQGVVVAVMDTGVDIFHPDLASRYRAGENSWFDPNGEHPEPGSISASVSLHGTGVTGILVGGDASGNSIGVAPDSQWIAVKIFNDQGQATTGGILEGFQWLLDPDGDPLTNDAPHIVNNSWYAGAAETNCDGILQDSIKVLRQAGIFPVFASGNDSQPLIPAAYPESVAVGNVDENDLIDPDSGQGITACPGRVFYPDLVAPGVRILTAAYSYGGLITSMQTVDGTSFSAPHVAGAAALLLSANPSLTVEELESVLSETAMDLGVTGDDFVYGKGRIDVLAAFNLLVQRGPARPPRVQVKTEGSGKFEITWDQPPSTSSVYTYSIFRNGVVLIEGLSGTTYTDMVGDASASFTYAVSSHTDIEKSESTKALLGNIHQGNGITSNRIDGFDLAALMESFGTGPSDEKWSAESDLNGDQTINKMDLDILIIHFGQVMK